LNHRSIVTIIRYRSTSQRTRRAPRLLPTVGLLISCRRTGPGRPSS
jgi:hypothetical protein